MKLSKSFWQTYKEVPADAEIVSHQLSLRANLVSKQEAGLYSYLPMAVRSLQKIEKIIREELNAIDAQEVIMPVVTSGALWEETGRLESFGPLMLKAKDRNNRELCISPTNEEAVTDVFRRQIQSYKQLPVNLYQINTKFRNEIRPRYGLMRAREFTMKDAYSFHGSWESLQETYQQMFQAYSKIFQRLGLRYMVVEADAGAMSDSNSKTQEFQVLAQSGEDVIIFCTNPSCHYAANLEKAHTQRPMIGAEAIEKREQKSTLTKVHTPKHTAITEVARFLQIPAHACLKALVYEVITGEQVEYVMILLLGDDSLNEVKAKGILRADHLRPAGEGILAQLQLPVGFLGPYGLTSKIKIYYDQAINLQDAYCIGGMESDYHYLNFVPERDGHPNGTRLASFDFRLARAEDQCPHCQHLVAETKGIEVGHIFQLGDKYTRSMKVNVVDDQGKSFHPLMGCYGIGVTRTLAAAIEQNCDQQGIIWPVPIAPYHVHFVVIGKGEAIWQLAENTYRELLAAGLEVLMDDRKLSPGVMLKDADLLGLPLRVVLGERDYAQDGTVEVKERQTARSEKCLLAQLPQRLQFLLDQLRTSRGAV